MYIKHKYHLDFRLSLTVEKKNCKISDVNNSYFLFQKQKVPNNIIFEVIKMILYLIDFDKRVFYFVFQPFFDIFLYTYV